MPGFAALLPEPGAPPPGSARLRAEVRAFLAESRVAGHWTPRVDAWLAGWDETFSRALGARGWLGMTVPVDYGGRGATALERFVVIEELLAAGAPVAAHWIADRQIAPALLRYGTEQQRRRFLPGIAAGETYFAIGMSEPDAGSDLADVRTRAGRVAGGWEVTGRKVWTSGAHHAHAMVTLVRTEPRDAQARRAGLSQLIVDLRGPGVEVRPIHLLTGAHHFNEVVLDRAFVPDEMVLGTPGQGWEQVTAELAYERSGPERFLSAQPLLESAARRADDVIDARRAIGRLTAQLWTLRCMSLAVAAALDAGSSPDVAAAVVKDVGTRYENDVVDTVRRLAPVETGDGEHARLLSDAILHAPGFTLRGGTNEILRGVVARGLGLR